jgi:hypothetical protein
MSYLFSWAIKDDSTFYDQFVIGVTVKRCYYSNVTPMTALVIWMVYQALWMHWDVDKLLLVCIFKLIWYSSHSKLTEYAILIYFEFLNVFKHMVIPMRISVHMHVTPMITSY